MLYKDFFLYSFTVSFLILAWINITGIIYNKLLDPDILEIIEEEKPLSQRKSIWLYPRHLQH